MCWPATLNSSTSCLDKEWFTFLDFDFRIFFKVKDKPLFGSESSERALLLVFLEITYQETFLPRADWRSRVTSDNFFLLMSSRLATAVFIRDEDTFSSKRKDKPTFKAVVGSL